MCYLVGRSISKIYHTHASLYLSPHSFTEIGYANLVAV